eukprot:3576417-Amphidinium_carterae.1
MALLAVGCLVLCAYMAMRCKAWSSVCGVVAHGFDVETAELAECSQPLLNPNLAEGLLTQGLSISTVRLRQYVRATSSQDFLQSKCQAAELDFRDRIKCVGEVGLVLHLDEVDCLAWVAFKGPKCQGWFPLACLRDAGKADCLGPLQKPDLNDALKCGMIGLSEGIPSPEPSS